MVCRITPADGQTWKRAVACTIEKTNGPGGNPVGGWEPVIVPVVRVEGPRDMSVLVKRKVFPQGVVVIRTPDRNEGPEVNKHLQTGDSLPKKGDAAPNFQGVELTESNSNEENVQVSNEGPGPAEKAVQMFAVAFQ